MKESNSVTVMHVKTPLLKPKKISMIFKRMIEYLLHLKCSNTTYFTSFNSVCEHWIMLLTLQTKSIYFVKAMCKSSVKYANLNDMTCKSFYIILI